MLWEDELMTKRLRKPGRARIDRVVGEEQKDDMEDEEDFLEEGEEQDEEDITMDDVDQPRSAAYPWGGMQSFIFRQRLLELVSHPPNPLVAHGEKKKKEENKTPWNWNWNCTNTYQSPTAIPRQFPQPLHPHPRFLPRASGPNLPASSLDLQTLRIPPTRHTGHILLPPFATHPPNPSSQSP